MFKLIVKYIPFLFIISIGFSLPSKENHKLMSDSPTIFDLKLHGGKFSLKSYQSSNSPCAVSYKNENSEAIVQCTFSTFGRAKDHNEIFLGLKGTPLKIKVYDDGDTSHSVSIVNSYKHFVLEVISKTLDYSGSNKSYHGFKKGMIHLVNRTSTTDTYSISIYDFENHKKDIDCMGEALTIFTKHIKNRFMDGYYFAYPFYGLYFGGKEIFSDRVVFESYVFPDDHDYFVSKYINGLCTAKFKSTSFANDRRNIDDSNGTIQWSYGNPSLIKLLRFHDGNE